MDELEQAKEAEPQSDSRGRVMNAADVRRLRNREQWERYDSIMVGPGASQVTKGWFNSFTEFARVSQIMWFQSRDSNVDLCYTNQRSERYDYAQDLYNFHLEFIASTFEAEFDSLGASAKAMQNIWCQELPKALGIEVLLADADIIAQGPATAFMAGRGNSGGYATDTGATLVHGGTNGVPNKENGWAFPEPIMIASHAKLTVRAQIGQPIKDLIQAMEGPGTSLYPNGQGGYVEKPNWYGVRATFRGPRYMQLRGARSR